MSEVVILIWLQQLTGIDQASLVFIIGMAYAVANYIARSIPESETGWRGFVRTIASYVALYRSKKLAPGITVNDVTQALADKGVGSGEAQPVVRNTSDGKFTR